MTRLDTLVSAEAWNYLRELYYEIGGEDADDHDLAEILRRRMIEVEG